VLLYLAAAIAVFGFSDTFLVVWEGPTGHSFKSRAIRFASVDSQNDGFGIPQLNMNAGIMV
jgi:hypothetical protein